MTPKKRIAIQFYKQKEMAAHHHQENALTLTAVPNIMLREFLPAAILSFGSFVGCCTKGMELLKCYPLR